MSLSNDDIGFILESLQWAKMGYEDRAAKYLHDPHLPNYYEDIYSPKLRQFEETMEKLRSMRNENTA